MTKNKYTIIDSVSTITKGKFYLMEHNIYGEKDTIITNAEGNIIIYDCYNGFDELIDYFDSSLPYGQYHLL